MYGMSYIINYSIDRTRYAIQIISLFILKHLHNFNLEYLNQPSNLVVSVKFATCFTKVRGQLKGHDIAMIVTYQE